MFTKNESKKSGRYDWKVDDEVKSFTNDLKKLIDQSICDGVSRDEVLEVLEMAKFDVMS